MSLPRTYRLVAATVAVLLLFGGATPLVMHACAQLGLFSHDILECCEDEPEPLHDHLESLPPCHDEEPEMDGTVIACCTGETHEADSPTAILPKNDVTHPLLAAPVTADVVVPTPDTSPSETISARAPPLSPDAPLFILFEALLN